MTTGEALLAAVLTDPDDDTVRLVYADYLEERGHDLHAEFVRVQCDIERNPGFQPPEADPRRRRERELYRDPKLRAALRDPALEYCIPVLDIPQRTRCRDPFLLYRRGFVEYVICTVSDWIKFNEAITASHPVQEVAITTWMDWGRYRSRADGKLWHISSNKQAEEYLAAQFPGIRFQVCPSAEQRHSTSDVEITIG